jgi:hypothetical protein
MGGDTRGYAAFSIGTTLYPIADYRAVRTRPDQRSEPAIPDAFCRNILGTENRGMRGNPFPDQGNRRPGRGASNGADVPDWDGLRGQDDRRPGGPYNDGYGAPPSLAPGTLRSEVAVTGQSLLVTSGQFLMAADSWVCDVRARP